jgi:hypothetical protein
MDLFYGTSSYIRQRGNLPELPVINMFAESEVAEDGITLQSRPGIEDEGTMLGNGPVKALYSIDGVLGGSLFAVSNDQFWRDGISKGAINGAGPAKIAGFEDFVFATQGSSLWGYDGATLAAVTVPGGFNTLSLCIGASRLIIIDSGTGSFYWSDPLLSTIDVLAFATAENSPDKLKECIYIGDTLILFGSKTVEFWPVTSDPDAPFQPLVGRTFQIGIRDTGCAVEFNGTFAWITDRNQICVTSPDNLISYPGLEARIKDSTSWSLWTFVLEGTEFLALRLDGETWVYSSRSGTWSQFENYGEDNFLPQCFAADVFGSAIDGRLLQFTTDYSDFGAQLERRFRAGTLGNIPGAPLYNVFLRTNPGQTPFVSADDPIVEMRISKDGGFTWGAWRQRSLGARGEYRKRIQWTGLGMFSYPGILCEFRVTDPVPFRVSKVVANDPYGGV